MRFAWTSISVRPVAVGLFFLGAIALTGCSKGKGSVSGKVTVGGKPVYSGTITFFVGKEQGVGGPITDGNYKLSGVPVGEAKVVVVSPEPKTTESQGFKPDQAQLEKMPKEARKKYEEDERKAKEAKAKWKEIPMKYTELESTTLTTPIKKGANSYDAKCD